MPNLDNAYSPDINNMGDVYSPTLNNTLLNQTMGQTVPLNESAMMNTMQNVEGLDRLPPDVRQQALSSLNTMPSQGVNMPLSYNLDNQPNMNDMTFNQLPTMNDIQNQNLGNMNFAPQSLQMPMMQQQQAPTVNFSQAQSVLGNLPEGYNGNIPLELAANLPMIGGGEKKKQ